MSDPLGRLRALQASLKDIEMHCPCGARPESLHTHPHVIGCPVYRALTLADELEQALDAGRSAPREDKQQIVDYYNKTGDVIASVPASQKEKP